MARQPSPEIDDELFNEVYGKEYTGPPRTAGNSGAKLGSANKRSAEDRGGDGEEEEAPDPNAVPTDFTSREARVWEAKAKAIEKNWKKKKEEEMICKICGESGHFTQGCPSTLGANRKTADFLERVPARDKNVRALFSAKVIGQIEKDVGCKIKMDEKFLIVSGKDRLILSKGVDAVHKLIQNDKNKSSTSSHRTRSKSPVRSPADSHHRRSESHRPYSSPRNTSRLQGRSFNQERAVEDRIREDLQKLSRDSPHAYANDGRGQSTRSRSPPRSIFRRESFSSLDNHNPPTGVQKTDNWNMERQGIDFHSEKTFNFPYPQTVEELELEFKREAMEVEKIRYQEEDEENYKYRECIRELRENYLKKLAIMRGTHLKQWEEFLQLDIQRRRQFSANYNAYNQPAYREYNQSSRDAQYAGTNLPMDSRSREPFPNEDYPVSRPRDIYGEIQHQRHDDFGRAYGRY